jgi:hypothetical protein
VRYVYWVGHLEIERLDCVIFQEMNPGSSVAAMIWLKALWTKLRPCTGYRARRQTVAAAASRSENGPRFLWQVGVASGQIHRRHGRPWNSVALHGAACDRLFSSGNRPRFRPGKASTVLVAGRPGQFGDCLSAPLIKEISHSAGRWQRFSSFRTGWRTGLLSSTGHGGVMRRRRWQHSE